MKKIILLVFALISLQILTAQGSIRLKSYELTFLVDITDGEIFSQIKTDFLQNLPIFFQATGLGKIKEMEKFTLSVAPINSTGELILTSKSIAIPRKGMALQDVKKLSNPQPLMSMLKKSLALFDSIKMTNNERSYIIDIVLKTISQANESAERNVIVVLSDLIEYSPIHNMYKKIPSTPQEISIVLQNIDPMVLQRARQKIQSGCDPELVIILKQKPGLPSSSQVKQFWTSLLSKIGIKTIVFLDNFTQNPQI